jgi:hypothetical protein
MTMDEALKHEWLAGPSSQPQGSRIRSDAHVFAIQDFDEDEGRSINMGDRSESPRLTEAGTNLEIGREDSDGSFSQPTGNLNLGTTVARSRNPADGLAHDMAVDSPSTHAAQPVPSPPPPLETSNLKRKPDGDWLGRDPFSSGSLSPAPSDATGAEPTPSKRTKMNSAVSPRRSSRVKQPPRS